MLKNLDAQERLYDIDEVNDFDEYDNAGYDELLSEESEEFVVEGGETI